MGATVAGQRAGGLWGSFSLGEAADAVWRVADEIGSAVEATSVHVHMPQTATEFPRVEVIVPDSLDVMHLHERLGLTELPGLPTSDALTWAVDQTMITVRVARES
jgi:hypothetical protein